MIETTLQDLRFGLRMLRRAPGSSPLAILCLTLGIGANATVFSWIEGILLRPYPKVAQQDRLLSLAGTTRAEFIAEKITGSTLSIGDHAERATGSMVSANYFDALGVHPILGRGVRACWPGPLDAATRPPMAVTALAACLVPAWRAMRIDPVRALRD